eukprot:TRINITY_DN9352_c0_g1_i1.p1 TRINITY_DN9352_c0_g1~~TRINITY_DN9352_c0_g1_i1.p1  ORF type:complete len:552 (+),score=58.75 TRINITY_DN9352_c0_g1_i1:97-1656(+)
MEELKAELEQLQKQLSERNKEIEGLKKAHPKQVASLYTPTFLKQLAVPETKNVIIIGCGGGFDFVQAMLLYPELKKMGKNITIVSNSFTDIGAFHADDAPIVWESDETHVKTITAKSQHPSPKYLPEVHLCTFLDSTYPEEAPHSLYGCNATKWSVPGLTSFLQYICSERKIGAVVTLDGGADSLLRGDEGALGHPIEDTVTVGAVAALGDVKGHRKVHVKGIDAALSDSEVLDFARESGELIDAKLADPRQGKRGSRKMRYGTFEFSNHDGASSLVSRAGTQLGRFVIACEWDRGEAPVRILVCANLGADRVSGVADTSALRGISEITKIGGYLGSVGIEPSSPIMSFFNSLLEHMDSHPPGPGYFKPHPDSPSNDRSCRGALHHAEAMCTLGMAVEGYYGPVGQKGDFVWPVMSVLWAFDPQVVAERSLILRWIKDAPLNEVTAKFQQGRRQLRDLGAIVTLEYGREGQVATNGGGIESSLNRSQVYNSSPSGEIPTFHPIVAKDMLSALRTSAPLS